MKIAVFFGLFLGILSPLHAGIEVQDALIAKDVLARQPVAPGEEFSPNVGRLVFWTKIFADTVPVNVIHVWYYQGKELSRMPLTVKTAVWRTWSRKTIYPHQTGEWKAVVQDESGNVIAEAAFVVKEPAPQEEERGAKAPAEKKETDEEAQ